MLTTTLLEQINKVFPLKVDETLKIQLVTSQGHRILAVGVTVWWYSRSGKRYRTTSQLGGQGLVLIPDRSPEYADLMEDLDNAEDDQAPDLLTSALYLYSLEGNKTCFRCFTRK